MPIFEYLCRACRNEFETLVTASNAPECPACRSQDLARRFSLFAVGGRSAARTARAPAGPCGTCGHPRGPGACSLDRN
jgi:putative FmdB family regulatory protein